VLVLACVLMCVCKCCDRFYTGEIRHGINIPRHDKDEMLDFLANGPADTLPEWVNWTVDTPASPDDDSSDTSTSHEVSSEEDSDEETPFLHLPQNPGGRKCRCGSSTHLTIRSHACPLNPRNRDSNDGDDDDSNDGDSNQSDSNQSDSNQSDDGDSNDGDDGDEPTKWRGRARARVRRRASGDSSDGDSSDDDGNQSDDDGNNGDINDGDSDNTDDSDYVGNDNDDNDGDSDNNDDEPHTATKRRRPEPVTAAAAPPTARKRVQQFKVGDKVEVYFRKVWYSAVIALVHVSKKGGYKVIYDIDNSYEPNVPKRRIRFT